MSRKSTDVCPAPAKGSKDERPRAIDLFCGCGGLTLGLEKAGFNVIGAVDIDDLSIETYRENHPEVHTWHCDITDLSVRKVKRELGLKSGELDLLAGCPPCQGFSSLRTLNGKFSVDDPRNDLVSEFMRLVVGLRPKTVMMENVPGLLEDHRLKQVTDQLTALGYEFEVRLINAADYAVPQRRWRMILLASEFAKVRFAPKAKVKTAVEDVLRGLKSAGESGDLLHDFPEARSQKVLRLIKKIPKDGGSRTDLDRSAQLPCHQKCQGFKDIYGRLAWKSVAPTITGGCTNPSKGRFLHPTEDRALTLREAALLQSFPKSYYFSLRRGKGPASVMIGNALPPEMIRRQAQAIIRHLQTHSKRVEHI